MAPDVVNAVVTTVTTLIGTFGGIVTSAELLLFGQKNLRKGEKDNNIVEQTYRWKELILNKSISLKISEKEK